MLRALAVALTLLAAVPVAAQAQAGPPPGESPFGEGVVEGQPPLPPLLQAGPGGPARSQLPCNLEGTLLDSFYPSGTKPLETVMLFADFADAPAEDAVAQEIFEGFVPRASAAARTLSQQRFELRVSSNQHWVRLPKTSEQYGIRGDVGYLPLYEVIAATVAAADAEVDFSGAEAVYVVLPPSFEHRSAEIDVPGDPFEADGAEMVAGVTLGTSEAYYRGFKVFLHESLHMIGLPDLYSYARGLSEFIGPWDVLSDVQGEGIPMLAWTRRQVGWLDRDDFRCVRATTTATLSPVDAAGGLKALAIRTGLKRAYVLEARTDQVGIGCENPGGVLLYEARAGGISGSGPLRLVGSDRTDLSCGSEFSSAQFIPGTERSGYATPDGRLKIEVTARRGDSFAVKVTIGPHACVVPRLLGATLGRASARLRDASCAVGEVTGPKRGRVVDQAQAPGTVLPPRGRVGLTVKRKG